MRKLKLSIAILALIVFQVSVGAQEKKIKFNKGTLKICSSKKFTITGYNGNEVIITSLTNNIQNDGRLTFVSGQNAKTLTGTATVSSTSPQTTYSYATKTLKKKDSGKAVSLAYFFNDAGRKEGLKKLGKKYENSEYGIYFLIEQKDGELIFKDNNQRDGRVVIFGNEHYEIKIPNSIKLEWKTDQCDVDTDQKKRSRFFYHSDPSSLSNFSGEVDIESTLTNIRLSDVTGPVTINTIGGNVTVEFDKKKPQKLYSIYSNNGFIDVQIPSNSSLTIDAEGKYIYSDVDFNILSEKEENDFGHIKTTMKLKSGSGSTKMKLNAGYGNIYLRKQ